MADELIYDEDSVAEEADDYRPPSMSIRRYYDERYKRKVSHVIRGYYHIFCPYGRSHEKRYELWQAMKPRWRSHCRRGWYDPMFIKKLYHSRVRYTSGTMPKGNYYRKITRKSNIGREEEFYFGDHFMED